MPGCVVETVSTRPEAGGIPAAALAGEGRCGLALGQNEIVVVAAHGGGLEKTPDALAHLVRPGKVKRSADDRQRFCRVG